MIRYAVKSRIGTYYNFVNGIEEFSFEAGCLHRSKRYAERVARQKMVGGTVEVYTLILKETCTPKPKQELPELDFSIG